MVPDGTETLHKEYITICTEVINARVPVKFLVTLSIIALF